MDEFLRRLKERKLVQWALAYGAASFAFLQGIDVVAQQFGWSVAVQQRITLALVVGFFLTLVLAWYHGEKGRQRVTGTELLIVAFLLLVGGGLIWRFKRVSSAASLAAAPASKTSENATPAAPATAAAPTRSIAVLPFLNLSSDKSQEYFAEGIAEQLLDLLTKIPTLRVAARTSSFSFQGQDLGVGAIARRLHVANILEGSVQRSGDEVRISAQLVQASDGYEIWSQTYDRKLHDIFKIQDEIAADVVKQLRIKLLGAPPTVLETDPRAYTLFLQARQLGYEVTEGTLARSDSLYRAALAIDARYAPAWSGLAANAINEASMLVVSNAVGLRRARREYATAVRLDPRDAPAEAGLGMVSLFYGKDLGAAAKHIQRALTLDPSNMDALQDAGMLLECLGRANDAVAVDSLSLAHDPVNPSTIFNIGASLLFSGRYEEAISKFHSVLTLDPGSAEVHYALGMALLLDSQPSAALAEMRQETSEPWRLIGEAVALHALGRDAESDSALAVFTKNYAEAGAYNLAYAYAYRGDADRAFEWLDKAVKYGDPGLTQILTERLFDPIRSDPRWLPFLRKIGRAPSQLAKVHFEVTLPRGQVGPASQ